MSNASQYSLRIPLSLYQALYWFSITLTSDFGIKPRDKSNINKIGMGGHLLSTTLVHAIFASYGDVLSACLNLMNVPVRSFFNESMTEHYGPMTEEK